MEHESSRDPGATASGGDAGKERHSVSGDRVIEKIRELIREGNVRHVVIKNEEGRTLIEFPVTVGVAGALLLPVWAAIGAVAAVVGSCSIEVERTDGGGPETTG